MNSNKIVPVQSFYELSAVSNRGETISFEQYRGNKLLIVNLASACGFTAQYAELEALYKAAQQKLVILGFPANDFGGQEPGTDEQIAQFCQINFGVTFPLFKKAPVSGNDKQPVYQWLTDAAKNGWNNTQPNWNFCKYIVNENGILEAFYSSAVSPLSNDIKQHL